MSFESAPFWVPAVSPQPASSLRVGYSRPDARPVLTAACVAAGALLFAAMAGFLVMAWDVVTTIHG